MNELLVNRLKNARNKSGLKQQEVANQLGVKANTISNWEKGRTEPDIDTFVKLCNIYQIDCAALLTDVYAFKRIGTDINLQEYDHIKQYRNLDKQGKLHVDTVLEWENERIKELSKKYRQEPEGKNFYDEAPDTAEELERLYPPVDIRKIHSHTG